MSNYGHETMKDARVKIVSCGRSFYWYANRVGEEFDVIIPVNNNASYVVNDTDNFVVRHIHREDAVIIDDSNNRSTEDLIASLASEVAQLKRDVRRLEENTKTFAETASEADYKAGQALMNLRVGNVGKDGGK